MSPPIEPPRPPPAPQSAATSPWQGDSPAVDRRSKTLRRNAARATGLILLGALLAVIFGSLPMIEASLTEEEPEPARRGLARALRERGWAVGPPEVREHRMFGPSRDERRSRRVPPELLENLFDDDPLEDDGKKQRWARPREPLALLEKPERGARPEVMIEPGTPLLVLRDTGDWLMLAVRREGRMVVGWTPRDEIEILP